MKKNSISDLKTKYNQTLAELKTIMEMKVQGEPGDYAGYELKLLVDRNEQMARALYRLILIRNAVRQRLDAAGFGDVEGNKVFRGEVSAFLSDLRDDIKTFENVSHLHGETIRSIRQVLYRLTSNT